jgi:hypothetical protein
MFGNNQNLAHVVFLYVIPAKAGTQ